MQWSSRASKARHKLSDSLEQRLNLYSVAASAAGLSVLALVCPASAEVVFTRAHLQITPDQTLLLDVNHDGINDFEFHDASLGVLVRPLQTGGALLQGAGCIPIPGPAALKVGAPIGAMRQFHASATCMASFSLDASASFGSWAGVVNRFLGVQFVIGGQKHYGWARLSVSRTPYTATLTGYAYETIPNHPIKAGQTSGTDLDAATSDGPDSGTLGALALGSAGLTY